MKLDLKDLDPMSKSMLYGYILPLSSVSYELTMCTHRCFLVLSTVFQIQVLISFSDM